jgi:glycosyltransferase involved in cell wall biosynthesis
MVGDGPDFVELAIQVKELELDNVIELTGYVDNQQKQKKLSYCHCFLLPSYFEGLPIALLEGMAAGHYVIATDVGAIPDIIVDEKRGILIKPGSSEDLYQAMKQVMLNTSKYMLLGRENRKIIEDNYTWDVVAKKIESIYKQ